MKKERIIGIDIIKSIAVLFVVIIHQIARTHVMAMNLDNAGAFMIIMLRYTVMSCVPMFIIATGYFQCHKTVSKRFYKGLIPILITYVLTTVICVIVQLSQGQELIASKVIIKTLNYTQNEYAWYVEMFVTLYLMIPFINMALGKTHKQRLLLIALLFLATVAPSTFVSVSTEELWFDLFPSYWEITYPLLYYALGAYIRDYQPRLNKLAGVLLLIFMMLLPTVVEFIQAGGGEFVDRVFNGFNSLSAFAIAWLIFMLLYDVKLRFRPLRRALMSISNCTLETYLLSYSVELVAYPIFEQLLGEDLSSWLWLMIIVVFLSSLILALALRIIIASVKLIISELVG